MSLTESTFDIPPVIARAWAARGYVPAQIKADRSYKAVRERLGYDSAAPRLSAPKAVSAASAAPQEVSNRLLRDIARIPEWGIERHARIREKIQRYRDDLLERIIAAAPERERKTIETPSRRSHAYRAALRLQARDIVCETAAAYGLTYDNLIARGRLREVVICRQEAMYRITRELRLSFVDVAKVMHRDDHTTIRSGCASHAERLKAIKAAVRART